MELEAVWIRDGEEIYCVDPVRELLATGGVESIVVYNGWGWHNYMDICNITGKFPNGFFVRERRAYGS